MRAADIRDAGAMRASDRAAAGHDASDDAAGFRRAVSGDGRGALRPQFARLDGVVSAAGSAHENSGAVSGGGQYASGAGRADGGAVGPGGGSMSLRGLGFDQNVPHDGYAWWYVDALSDDGENAITIIAFIGSVFSPYYAFARRRGAVDPLNHCAINVALYRKRGGHWAMTERPAHAMTRNAETFRVGPSALQWDGGSLIIDIDEITVPIPSRLKGRVRVTPSAITQTPFVLNQNGNHRWWPIAPCARVEVAMRSPGLSWQGDGYLDHNAGDAPIEDGFRDWQWARGATCDGAVIMYEGECRDGSVINLAKTFDRRGISHDFIPPDLQPLKRSGWRVKRSVRSESAARVVKTLEDAPFYARSVVSSRVNGEDVTLLHESLMLDRFRMPIVQAMLPFRMPRKLRNAPVTKF